MDQGKMSEAAGIEAGQAGHEPVRWRCHTKVEKFNRAVSAAEIAAGAVPDEAHEVEGNLLVTAGATALWNALTQGSAGAFQNGTAAIGVGDSSTAAAVGQTDLQASTNKLRKGMEATYPQVSNANCVFRSVFGSSEANFAWAEWGVFSATSAGTMLNRRVEALGTKAAGSTWTITITLSLS